jgi:phosphoenolpyruvate synthase/pyruvate phosphate dikinase
MFFDEERIPWVRRMILANDEGERKESLARLLPMQQSDFEGIFAALPGLPITIRLLDPPLHEFLPHGDEEISPSKAEVPQGFRLREVAIVEDEEAHQTFQRPPRDRHALCRVWAQR